MGIYVTDLYGSRIGIVRAIVRSLAATLTNFTLLLGYLLMLWTKRRQTLYDLIAGTVVLRTR